MQNTITKNECKRCLKSFPTSKGLHIHKTRRDHWRDAPVPSPLPVKKTLSFPGALPEHHNLLGGANSLKLGDKVTITTEYVISKITYTSGSLDVDTELTKVAKGSWSKTD